MKSLLSSNYSEKKPNRLIFIYYVLFFLFVIRPGIATAQVLSNGAMSGSILSENAFLDASTNFNIELNKGKGLVFPQTDLTSFTFITGNIDGILFPSAFDGMIVYNTGTGKTVLGQGIQTDVKPGFYYFSNSTGVSTQTVTGGTWIRMSDGNDAISSASATVYYGVLATTTPTAAQIQALANKSLGSGAYNGKFDQSLTTAGYFTVALPASWRNPALKISGNDTWNMFNALTTVTINNVTYQVWQTDVELPLGEAVAVN